MHNLRSGLMVGIFTKKFSNFAIIIDIEFYHKDKLNQRQFIPSVSLPICRVRA